MATYKVGSSGSGVRELQELLNQNGANLTVDGIYGSNTANAVRQYQQSNGLTVDGIAGDETFGSLRGTSSATGTTQTAKTTAQMLKEYETNRPADYTSSWQDQIDSLLGQITDRKPFQYDFASDALYQQYADNYQRMGKLAMQDTMGQAAALTGGYGNTYATTAGQQMYNQYMQDLNSIIPELQQNAYNMYADEGDRLAQMLAMYQGLEDTDYGRYTDQYNQWLAERDYWYNKNADEQALAAAASRGSSGGSSRSSSSKGWSESTARDNINDYADYLANMYKSRSYDFYQKKLAEWASQQGSYDYATGSLVANAAQNAYIWGKQNSNNVTNSTYKKK